jgi:hypothetical protein
VRWLIEQPHLVVDVAISRGSRVSRRRRAMFAELLGGDRGTPRALPFFMDGAANLERINGEQIATVTDLLLLRARNAKRRLSSNKEAFAHDPRVDGRAPIAHGSSPSIPTRPSVPSLGPHPSLSLDPDRTLFVRVRRAGTSTTSAAVLATAFAIGIILTALL